MARLLVRLHGDDVSRITLENGIEYVAGRAADANIQLGDERGISRHHLKFFQRDGVWICESLSKFMPIQKGGQSVDVIELGEACAFSVPPYEFHFEPNPQPAAAPSAEKDAAPAESNLPVFYQPRVAADSPDDTNPGMGAPRANNEATVAGISSNLVPYIRISFPNTADDEVLKLEGHLWVAGREPNCEIPIDSPHVSRKHFELARTNEGFYITDLGSSNGTKINGQMIPPHEPTRVESGDEIGIKTIEMIFEIRDTNFNHRVGNLPVAAFDPALAAPPAPYYAHEQNELTQYQAPHYDDGGGDYNAPVPWKQIRPHHMKDPDVRKKVIRAGLIALIVLMGAFYLMPSGKKPDRDIANKPSGTTSLSFEKLTNEQRGSVKDSFNLARNLYVQGKYELCLTELAKVHEVIPLYENSKELESFCNQGRELVQRQRDLERKERERQAIEAQIAGYVESCVAQLKDEGTVEETRKCLGEAMELDPEHHLIVEVMHNAQSREEERKRQADERFALDKKAAKGSAHYQRIKKIYTEGQLFKAAAEYEKFLATSYPKSDGLKNTARRELASIKSTLKANVSQQLDLCKSLGNKSQYKEAWKACNKAVEADPGNETAKTERNRMMMELKRELKSIYEDSVLEESLGNVDSAKEKWKKIVKDDVERGEYGSKAKSKLQKYGLGN